MKQCSVQIHKDEINHLKREEKCFRRNIETISQQYEDQVERKYRNKVFNSKIGIICVFFIHSNEMDLC